MTGWFYDYAGTDVKDIACHLRYRRLLFWRSLSVKSRMTEERRVWGRDGVVPRRWRRHWDGIGTGGNDGIAAYGMFHRVY